MLDTFCFAGGFISQEHELCPVSEYTKLKYTKNIHEMEDLIFNYVNRTIPQI